MAGVFLNRACSLPPPPNSAFLKEKNTHKGSVRGTAYLSGAKNKNYRQGSGFTVTDSSEVNKIVSKMQGFCENWKKYFMLANRMKDTVNQGRT